MKIIRNSIFLNIFHHFNSSDVNTSYSNFNLYPSIELVKSILNPGSKPKDLFETCCLFENKKLRELSTSFVNITQPDRVLI